MRRITSGLSRQSNSKAGWVAVLGLALVACATSPIPRATPGQTRWAAQRWPGVTPSMLAADRELYINKCSGCHTLRLPSVYAPDRWPQILDKMQKRAKLTDSDKERILRYVLTVKEKAL